LRLIAAGLILVALAVILVPGPARADATVPVATQADAIPEPAASTDIYKPPPRGAPANRVGAATRDLSRVALVIGNGAYQHLPRLENPADDARLIATRLQSVGFQLVGGEAQTDLDRAGLERAIRPFGDSIAFWPKEPSPCRQMTWVPGLAALAPTANGKPTPPSCRRARNSAGPGGKSGSTARKS
jgi:Caspase domain